MITDREALSIPDFEDRLDDFAPRGAGRADPDSRPRPASETRRSVDAVSHFPSRDPAQDSQLNLKGPRAVLDRFRKMCKDDRRAYYDMLNILMDAYEARNRT